MDTDVELLRAACERDLGDPGRWFSAVGYPKSLALCVIDAMYSTGARHVTVERVVSRYRDYRAGQGGDADTDGVDELLATVHELGGPDAWASRIGNRRPTSTAPNSPLRSVAVVQVVEALAALGIRTAEELRAAADDDTHREQAKEAWCGAPGQRSGFTWEYALMLAHIAGTPADRVVVGYVAREVGDLSAAQATDLMRGVAEAAGWDPAALEYAIWRFESGRPYQRAS